MVQAGLRPARPPVVGSPAQGVTTERRITMPVVLWLLGVPLVVIVALYVLHVI